MTPVTVTAAQVAHELPDGFVPLHLVSREGWSWDVARSLNRAAGRNVCVDCLALSRSKYVCSACGCPEVLPLPNGNEDIGPIVRLLVTFNVERPVRGSPWFAADYNASIDDALRERDLNRGDEEA